MSEVVKMKRYSLYYGIGGDGVYADGSAYWGQFPAEDKHDAMKQASRLCKHHNLPGSFRVKYVGKWSDEAVIPDQYV